MPSLLASGAMMRSATMATTRSRSREARASTALSKPSRRMAGQHRLDVAVRQRAHHLQPVLEGPELLALQHAPDRLDLIEGKRRQIGQGALADAIALAHALTQQIRRPRIAVRDRVDVHDAHKP